MSAVGGAALTENVFFYVNLVLVFCALIEAAAFIVLCKKTVCAYFMGFSAVVLFGFGLVLFVPQLVLFAYGHHAAKYLIYLGFGVLCIGFVAGGAYAGMLSRNSHKALCFTACCFNLVPPVGAALAVKLSKTIGKDTHVQALVYNGYAYTYAALGEFCARNDAEFVDLSGNIKFDKLNRKQTRKYVKKLKKSAVNAEGRYNYAAALVHYYPYKYKKAVKLMQRAADVGHAPALFNLGYYYEIGAYVKQDYKKAKALYTGAVDAGDADAALRLGIISVKSGNVQEGMSMLRDRMDQGDLCAKYDIGICYERGIGVERDVMRALDIYKECSDAGLFVAQKRIFSIASRNINSAQNGDAFRNVTDRSYSGTFKIMIKGLIEIKKRHAADAAKIFLEAVKRHDQWEGVARCLVGTLYIDCGKLDSDRRNGAEYIKSAIPLLPDADSIYSVIPKSVYK